MLFDAFVESLDGKKFESVEEFDAKVKQISNDIEEGLGRAERWALSHDPDVYEQLGVTIKGVYPDPEEEE